MKISWICFWSYSLALYVVKTKKSFFGISIRYFMMFEPWTPFYIIAMSLFNNLSKMWSHEISFEWYWETGKKIKSLQITFWNEHIRSSVYQKFSIQVIPFYTKGKCAPLCCVEGHQVVLHTGFYVSEHLLHLKQKIAWICIWRCPCPTVFTRIKF